VHRHQKILAIEGWSNPSHIWSDVEKSGEDNWKVGKISWIENQTPTLGLNMIKFEHDGFKYLVGKHVLKCMMV
jgi:hypothetical protein